MPLDPQVRTFLDQLAALNAPPIDELSPEEARANSARTPTRCRLPEPRPEISDLDIPGPGSGIPLRVYRPDRSRRLPVIVYFHGGGWVLGSIESHDALCQQLAIRVPAVVVSVGYRLAPEYRFPAALEDCVAATTWVAACARELGGDPTRLAVAGDSAGGNLAAVTAIQARDHGGPAIAYQLLVYPVTDSSMGSASYQANAEGYMLTAAGMRWFWDLYLGPDGQVDNPLASPVKAPDLAGLPPAFVITAEFDPLRDEGEHYAELLRNAGVETRLSRYSGMIHGFFGMNRLIDAADRAIEEASAALRDALASEAQHSV